MVGTVSSGVAERKEVVSVVLSSLPSCAFGAAVHTSVWRLSDVSAVKGEAAVVVGFVFVEEALATHARKEGNTFSFVEGTMVMVVPISEEDGPPSFTSLQRRGGTTVGLLSSLAVGVREDEGMASVV